MPPPAPPRNRSPAEYTPPGRLVIDTAVESSAPQQVVGGAQGGLVEGEKHGRGWLLRASHFLGGRVAHGRVCFFLGGQKENIGLLRERILFYPNKVFQEIS